MTFLKLQEYANQRGISVYQITAASEYRYKISIPVFGPAAGPPDIRGRKPLNVKTLKEAQAVIDKYWKDPIFQANVKRAKR